MEIPAKIILLNQEWTIEMAKLDDSDLGEVLFDTHTIRLSNDIKNENELLSAFLHECFHIFGRVNLNDDGECFAYTLESFIMHILNQVNLIKKNEIQNQVPDLQTETSGCVVQSEECL